MVRFSCFAAHVPYTKSKKTLQLSAEMMHKASEEYSEIQSSKDFNNSSGATPLHLKVHEDSVCITSDNVTSSASIQRNWKSDEVKLPCQNESCVGAYKSRIHKSKSEGGGLDQNPRFSCGNDSDNEIGQSISTERSHDQNSSVISVGNKEPVAYPTDWFPEAPASLHAGSGSVNHESIFLIGDPEQFEKGEKHENSDTQYSVQYAGESSNLSLHTPRIISKSRSLPNLFVYDGHSTTMHLLCRSASCENLDILYSKRQEMFGSQIIQDVERDNNVKYNVENPTDDCFDGYNHVGVAKEWIVPVMDDTNPMNNPQAEPLFRNREDLPSKDFRIKRIEEWIFALESCSPFEEKHELSTSSDQQVDIGVTVFDVSSTGKHDVKITPGMEAVKRYVSSLSATATSAQLCNHGLVEIPFLSAFVSLKELNLSGNTIARITAGALPRGLHILNLSKNNISTIEGLRELTRLRVLDLSYNRILRIGHGLASCSPVKQLYLAGNKISEVEGLHRLLKLNVLDLRFNKISTTKCLGQLAANYNSLQAISLEGNPAQKNVGDEQLKKYLQSLLPHLAYYNRQSIKAGTLKDSADRSARLGISSHQIDRSLRSEHKRKGNHGLAAHKRQSSSTHGRRSQRSQQAVALPKLSRDRQGRLAPSGINTNVRPRVHDFGSKMLSFRPDLALQRSHSEGNLGAH